MTARRLTLTFALVVAMVVAPAAPGTAHEARSDHRSVPYLALGDSLPYGWDVFGPAGQGAAPSFHVGYPEVYGQRSPFAVTNASCPGETSASFISRTAGDNGCSRVLAGPGIKVAWGGSQLDFATRFLREHPDTGLVTLQLGANDLFVCERTAGAACDVAQVLRDLGANLGRIVGTLRGAGDYDGPIVLVGYYAIDYRRPADVALGMAAAGVMGAVAASADGVVVADGFGAFAVASLGSRGDPCAAGLLLPDPRGGCDIHASPKGDRVLAQAVHRAYRVSERLRHKDRV